MKQAILLIIALLIGCGGASDPVLTSANLEIKGQRLDNAYNKLSKGLYSENGKNVGLKKIPEAWYTMGTLHNRAKEYDKMLAAFDRAKTLEIPMKEKRYTEKISGFITSVSNSNYNKAVHSYNRILKTEDEAAKLALTDSAINYVNVSIKLNDKSADSYGMRARLKALKKESAEADYIKAIELEPTSADLNQQLGYYYFNSKEYKKAAVSLEKALEIKKDDPSLVKYIAFSHQNSGNYEKAISTYTNLLKNDPNNSDAIDNLTPLYYSQKMYEETIANATLAINMNPECKKDHYVYLSNSYFTFINKLNDDKKRKEAKAKAAECIALMEKGIATDMHKENGELWKYISYLYAQVGDKKKSKNAEKMSKKFGN